MKVLRRSEEYRVRGYSYARIRVYDLQEIASWIYCPNIGDPAYEIPVITGVELAKFKAGRRADGTIAEDTVEVENQLTGITKRVPKLDLSTLSEGDKEKIRETASLSRGLRIPDELAAQLEASLSEKE